MSKDKKTGCFVASIKFFGAIIPFIIILANGYEQLDIPNYPVEVTSPLILDYDSTPEAVDFSLVTTKDGMKHFCFEIETNSGLIYYDATNKYYLNNNDIETVEKYEEAITGKVTLIKGCGDPRQLKDVATALIEEYSQKELVKK